MPGKCTCSRDSPVRGKAKAVKANPPAPKDKTPHETPQEIQIEILRQDESDRKRRDLSQPEDSGREYHIFVQRTILQHT